MDQQQDDYNNALFVDTTKTITSLVTTQIEDDTCIRQKPYTIDDLSEMSPPSDDGDDSYTTYYDEEEIIDDDDDDENDKRTDNEVFKLVSIEWMTSAISRILSDDDNNNDADADADNNNNNAENDESAAADADDERTATPKQQLLNLEWPRLGILSEAISQLIEEEECLDDIVVAANCIEERGKAIERVLPLLSELSSSEESTLT
jgi:hypothetical protein